MQPDAAEVWCITIELKGASRRRSVQPIGGFERVVIFLEVAMETNKLKRAWIWLWYNDVTRFAVLLGLPIIPVILLVAYFFGVGEYLRTVAMFAYMFTFGWMIIDNDYSNLRRIGMTEYRKKI